MEFEYQALSFDGERSVGVIEAPDEAAAAASLRGRGLFPTRLLPGGGAAAPARTEAKPGRSWPGLVRSADVAMFLSQLGLMLRSGLTLLYALEAMSREASKPALRACAQRVGAAVQAGRPLSEALAAERLLPAELPRLVQTAEATGALDQAFERCATLVERRAELRLQLMTSLAYPFVVVVATCGVFVFLTTKVVPKFAALLARRRVSLPWTTQKLMDVSEFLIAHGPAIGAWAIALVVLLAAAWHTARGRRAIERAALSTPVVGKLLQASALSSIARTLGLLLQSGLPLLQSLQAVRGTTSFATYQDVMDRAHERVTRGSALAPSLDDPLIPAVSRQVVAVGEETGALDEVVSGLGEFYERRVQQLVRTLSSLVEPVLLIVIGGMVGFVYLSFFQAVFRVAAR